MIILITGLVFIGVVIVILSLKHFKVKELIEKVKEEPRSEFLTEREINYLNNLRYDMTVGLWGDYKRYPKLHEGEELTIESNGYDKYITRFRGFKFVKKGYLNLICLDILEGFEDVEDDKYVLLDDCMDIVAYGQWFEQLREIGSWRTNFNNMCYNQLIEDNRIWKEEQKEEELNRIKNLDKIIKGELK